MSTESPYGSWLSSIEAKTIAAASLRIAQPMLAIGPQVSAKVSSSNSDAQPDLYWLEGRPTEAGRVVIVKHGKDGITDVLPKGFSARSLVHEYGGGAYLPTSAGIFFTNYYDQRIYCLHAQDQTDSAPQPITPEANVRYTDFAYDQSRNLLFCVMEDHRNKVKKAEFMPPEAENMIVVIDLKSANTASVLEIPKPVVTGHDFYSYPRLSPDGTKLSWLCWTHPHMPWDATEVWVADLTKAGELQNPRRVAGGEEESIFQPQWSPDGVLHYASDRNGWWHLYAQHDLSGGTETKTQQLTDGGREFGMPLWIFAMSTYGFLDDGRIAAAFVENGLWKLSLVSKPANRKDMPSIEILDLPFTDVQYVSILGSEIAALAATVDRAASIIQFDTRSKELRYLQTSNSVHIDSEDISRSQIVEVPGDGDYTIHTFFYPPTNSKFTAPNGELPPLIVKSHGGPTGATSAALNPVIQFWTSRGFAVVDVNYRGSTGFGRSYRRSLYGLSGVAEWEDCVKAALYLADKGLVDKNRMAISGGSAGGYTVLCAITNSNVFKAGACHYGISDVQALLVDTHKFESRYLEKLVGPYPECKQVYIDRSPIHHTEKIHASVIFFQGLDDKVVPPNQTERMVETLKNRGIAVAYVPFAGEQHGFRKAENISRAYESELLFFSHVFGFEPSDQIEPIEVHNLENLKGEKQVSEV